MWIRLFRRIGKRYGRLTLWGFVMLAVIVGMLAIGIYRLYG